MAILDHARSVRETIETCLSTDSEILRETAKLFSFAAVAISGEPLGMAAGLALISTTAAAAISSALAIKKRFFANTRSLEPEGISKYGRFRVLFYVTCLQCYIESVVQTMESLRFPTPTQRKLQEEHVRKLQEEYAKKLDQLRIRLKSQAKNVEEAETSFLFCVDPLDENIPLFQALDQWLLTALSYYGVGDYQAAESVKNCGQEARRRLNALIATDSEEAIWMRNYLAISRRENSTKAIIDNLSSIREVLDQWTSPDVILKQQEEQAWHDYRNDLRKLPDHKETMYNENFGVRKVFLEPRATYHVAGVGGDTRNAKTVPDLGRLLGTLVSDRISGEDLIVLCGGPGCGKSTVCRIFASELAQDARLHPVFLHLRRLREGSDIAHFIEESLNNIGVISRLSDLRQVPNLIVILDGFDELVMASRSRLRQFFNILRDEHSAGPLRNAKIIVSGRDTLFPGGEGLPTGSHIISLLPFDSARVSAWGEKWRAQHSSGPGKTFHPEKLLNGAAESREPPPLHHLVTLPLTLHLLARVHTAGSVDFNATSTKDIGKAYLYRSILTETATRQIDQAQGPGRLDPQNMRMFLRSLAWEMYSRSTDSMEPYDVMPILEESLPHAMDADISALADIAIVNCPQLTKGEQTGFEFVHKSFAEYLAAEHIANTIEKVIFKAPEFGMQGETWRMSDDEAASELAPVIGIRLITDEVQEMLEPMLGCLSPFLRGERVDQVLSRDVRTEGLRRIISRFQSLLRELLYGKPLDIIHRETQNRLLIRTPFEAYANQCAGYLLLGAAAARQLNTLNSEDRPASHYFNAAPFDDAFSQCLCLLRAGGLNIDDKLAARIFNGLTITEGTRKKALDETSLPIPSRFLSAVDGYRTIVSKSLRDYLDQISSVQMRDFMVLFVLSSVFSQTSGCLQRFEEFRRRLPIDTHSWYTQAFNNRNRSLKNFLDPRDVERMIREESCGQGTYYRRELSEIEYPSSKYPTKQELIDSITRLLRDIRHHLVESEDEMMHAVLYDLLDILCAREFAVEYQMSNEQILPEDKGEMPDFNTS